MLVANFSYSPLDFKRPSGTSRGILTKKEMFMSFRAACELQESRIKKLEKQLKDSVERVG